MLLLNGKMHAKQLAQHLLHNEPSEQSPIIRPLEAIPDREQELASDKCKVSGRNDSHTRNYSAGETKRKLVLLGKESEPGPERWMGRVLNQNEAVSATHL